MTPIAPPGGRFTDVTDAQESDEAESFKSKSEDKSLVAASQENVACEKLELPKKRTEPAIIIEPD